MAKKIKMVSISSIDKAIKDNVRNTTTIEWNDLEIEVKKVLSATEAFGFVDDCVKSVIDEDTYLPEAKDFIIRSNIIEKYTNISLPENFVHRYDILFTSDIISAVTSAIDHEQFHHMLEAIDDKINYLKDRSTSELNIKLNRLISAFESVYEQTENMYSGVEAEDIKKILSAVSGYEIDENAIMSAYINNTKSGSDE